MLLSASGLAAAGWKQAAPVYRVRGAQNCAVPSLNRTHRRHSSALRAYGGDPFEVFDRQFAAMEQQMQTMTRQMDAELAQMDREIGGALATARRAEVQAARDVERALAPAPAPALTGSSSSEARQEFFRTDGGVQIRRSEERGPGSYRFYESISISSGPRVAYYYPAQQLQPAVGPSPWLLLAGLLAGMYAALAAAFTRNVHLTKYSDHKGWQLALLWPLLLLSSRDFRQQFWAAVRGQRPSIKEEEGQQGSSSEL